MEGNEQKSIKVDRNRNRQKIKERRKKTNMHINCQ